MSVDSLWIRSGFTNLRCTSQLSPRLLAPTVVLLHEVSFLFRFALQLLLWQSCVPEAAEETSNFIQHQSTPQDVASCMLGPSYLAGDSRLCPQAAPARVHITHSADVSQKDYVTTPYGLIWTSKTCANGEGSCCCTWVLPGQAFP